MAIMQRIFNAHLEEDVTLGQRIAIPNMN